MRSSEVITETIGGRILDRLHQTGDDGAATPGGVRALPEGAAHQARVPATNPVMRSSTSDAEAQASWLGVLEQRFCAAFASAGGLLERDYTVGGRTMRLRFAGPALLEALTPAFDHLERDREEEPELTVNLWDSASTDTAPPPLPPIPPDGDAPGALYHYSDAHGQAVYQRGAEALSVLSSSLASSFYWVDSANDLPYWERAAPIRQILHWWLGAHGVQQVHAAAVGTPSGGVLLVGRGGSGKSTAALATIGSSLLYAGDDYVAVAMEPSPWTYSLYNSGKLEPDNLVRVPHVVPALANSDRLDSEKAVVYVHQHYPDSTATDFPLRAVLLPKVTDRVRPRLVEAPPAAALAALAPSTIFQLHTAGQDALERMTQMAKRLPSFVLELGSDIAAIPKPISDLLRQW
jgi:hypothetical protein